jgi:hypothetical protein
MFGRDWELTTAKIVAKKFKESGDRSGVWEYVADVTPRSGSAFRAELKQPPFMSRLVWLQEGEVVSVLADVAHQKAKFDKSDPRVSGKGRHSEQSGAAPAFDRDVWIALVQEGEEAAENAADPHLAAEINDLVDRFDSGRVNEAEYRARLAELSGRAGSDSD